MKEAIKTWRNGNKGAARKSLKKARKLADSNEDLKKRFDGIAHHLQKELVKYVESTDENSKVILQFLFLLLLVYFGLILDGILHPPN
jgi:hypothetical protein